MRSVRGRNGRNFPFGNPSPALSPSPVKTGSSHVSIGPTSSASDGCSSRRQPPRDKLRRERRIGGFRLFLLISKYLNAWIRQLFCQRAMNRLVIRSRAFKTNKPSMAISLLMPPLKAAAAKISPISR